MDDHLDSPDTMLREACELLDALPAFPYVRDLHARANQARRRTAKGDASDEIQRIAEHIRAEARNLTNLDRRSTVDIRADRPSIFASYASAARLAQGAAR